MFSLLYVHLYIGSVQSSALNINGGPGHLSLTSLTPSRNVTHQKLRAQVELGHGVNNNVNEWWVNLNILRWCKLFNSFLQETCHHGHSYCRGSQRVLSAVSVRRINHNVAKVKKRKETFILCEWWWEWMQIWSEIVKLRVRVNLTRKMSKVDPEKRSVIDWPTNQAAFWAIKC